MRYVRTQDPIYIRLSYSQLSLLRCALEAYIQRLRKTAPALMRSTRVCLKALPNGLPYDVTIYPHTWEIISAALRVGEPTPEAGSDEARWFALYHWLARRISFLTTREQARLKKRGIDV